MKISDPELYALAKKAIRFHRAMDGENIDMVRRKSEAMVKTESWAKGCDTPSKSRIVAAFNDVFAEIGLPATETPKKSAQKKKSKRQPKFSSPSKKAPKKKNERVPQIFKPKKKASTGRTVFATFDDDDGQKRPHILFVGHFESNRRKH